MSRPRGAEAKAGGVWQEPGKEIVHPWGVERHMKSNWLKSPNWETEVTPASLPYAPTVGLQPPPVSVTRVSDAVPRPSLLHLLVPAKEEQKSSV